MGRWVTSKGRRIYIPDEGEENPFGNGKGKGSFKVSDMKKREFKSDDEEAAFRKHQEDMYKESFFDKKVGEGGEVSYWKYSQDFAEFKKAAEEKGYDVSAPDKFGKVSLSKRKQGKTSKTISDNEAKKEKELAENKRQAENAGGRNIGPAEKEARKLANNPSGKVSKAEKSHMQMLEEQRRRKEGIQTNYGSKMPARLHQHSAIQKMAAEHVNKIWNGGAATKELYDAAEVWAKQNNVDVAKAKEAAFKAMNEKYVKELKKRKGQK